MYDRDKDVILATWKEMIGQGLRTAHPEDFGLYSEAQYQRHTYLNRFTENTRIGWAKAVCLTDSNAEVWLPAAFVFLPYQYRAGETQAGGCTRLRSSWASPP
jgi:hypothetical protein